MNATLDRDIDWKYEANEGAKGGRKGHRHEAVELSGLDHLPKPELLFVDGALAGFETRSRRFCILLLPWRVRHSPSLSLSPVSVFWCIRPMETDIKRLKTTAIFFVVVCCDFYIGSDRLVLGQPVWLRFTFKMGLILQIPTKLSYFITFTILFKK